MELKLDKTEVLGLLVAALNLGVFRCPVNVTDVKTTPEGHYVLAVEIIKKTEGGP